MITIFHHSKLQCNLHHILSKVTISFKYDKIGCEKIFLYVKPILVVFIFSWMLTCGYIRLVVALNFVCVFTCDHETRAYLVSTSRLPMPNLSFRDMIVLESSWWVSHWCFAYILLYIDSTNFMSRWYNICIIFNKNNNIINFRTLLKILSSTVFRIFEIRR